VPQPPPHFQPPCHKLRHHKPRQRVCASVHPKAVCVPSLTGVRRQTPPTATPPTATSQSVAISNILSLSNTSLPWQEACVAIESLALLDSPCGNNTIATLSRDERVTLFSNTSTSCNATTTAFVRVSTSSGQHGYAPASAFATTCSRYVVDDSPTSDSTTVYTVVGVVVGVIVGVLVLGLAAFCLGRRRAMSPPPPAPSQYDHIPTAPVQRTSLYSEAKVNIAAAVPAYAELSITEVVGK
jgi:hypothetical protein